LIKNNEIILKRSSV